MEHEDVMFVRVDADDFASLVASRASAWRQLRECERAAGDAAVQWRDELEELLEQFNGFRRAVQEALGYDQAELMRDDELIRHVRIQHVRWRVPTVPAAPLSEDAWERLAALPEVQVTVAAEQRAPFGKPFRLEQVYGTEQPATPRCGENIAPGRICDEAVPDGHCSEHGEVGPPIDHQYDAITYAKMIERERSSDDPPTASMPPVEQPPTIEGFKTGRVFTRGESLPEGITGWWGVAGRTGEIYTLSHFNADGLPVMTHANGDDDWCASWDQLLHMRGMVWEVLPLTRAAQAGVEALTDDEGAHQAADHD